MFHTREASEVMLHINLTSIFIRHKPAFYKSLQIFALHNVLMATIKIVFGVGDDKIMIGRHLPNNFFALFLHSAATYSFLKSYFLALDIAMK